MMLEKFKEQYQAEAGNAIAAEELINLYGEKVPAILIDIWKTTGLGKYNKGLIELVDPRQYENSLWTWLGRKVDNYIPFAITGFGELFYYRKLTETEEDVCMIDIQYRRAETLVWSMGAFFEEFLTNDQDKKVWLREELFAHAVLEKGDLQNGEIFTIVPILALGGAEELQYLQKGNAIVYQELVFQMTS